MIPQKDEKPKGFLETIKQQIEDNPKKTALLAVMIAVAPVAPIFTVAAGLIIAGNAGVTGYKTNKLQKAYKQTHAPKGPQKPKNMLGNLGQKIVKNKGKALLVGLTAMVFPAGTIIAASILAGTAVKAGLDSHKENKTFQQEQAAKPNIAKPIAKKFTPKPITPAQTPVRGQGKVQSQSR
jgi:hypothetical protein